MPVFFVERVAGERQRVKWFFKLIQFTSDIDWHQMLLLWIMQKGCKSCFAGAKQFLHQLFFGGHESIRLSNRFIWGVKWLIHLTSESRMTQSRKPISSVQTTKANWLTAVDLVSNLASRGVSKSRQLNNFFWDSVACNLAKMFELLHLLQANETLVFDSPFIVWVSE